MKDSQQNLSLLVTHINNKYNIIRIYLYDIIRHYIDVSKFYELYAKFISNNMYKKFNLLYTIAQTKVRIYTITAKNAKPPNNLPKDTIIIKNSHNYLKYKAIKFILKNILDYKEKIYRYLEMLQLTITKLINGLNRFYNLYKYSLNISFDNTGNNSDNLLYDVIKRFKFLQNVNKYKTIE